MSCFLHMTHKEPQYCLMIDICLMNRTNEASNQQEKRRSHSQEGCYRYIKQLTVNFQGDALMVQSLFKGPLVFVCFFMQFDKCDEWP